MKDIITSTKFDLPHGRLGNMSPYPIEYDGETWKTSEALFQALRFSGDSIREIIRNESSPMSAKMKAKKYRLQMKVSPMSGEDVENMRLCIRLKLEQSATIRFRLKATGSSTIIEDTTARPRRNNLFWGAKNENDNWNGKNMLGKVWMEYRDKLKTNKT